MLFAILWLPLLALGSGIAEHVVHPSDAPDVDLRIRIERDEVRYDVAMNLAFIDAVLDYPREIEEELHEVEYPGLHDALEEFLRSSHEVHADGAPVRPRVIDFAVERADMSMLPLFPRLGAKALIKARIVLVYSLESEPERIELGWGAYPPNELLQLEDMPAPPMTVQAVLSVTGDDRRLPFTPEMSSYVWRRKTDSFAPHFAEVPPAPSAASFQLPVVSLVSGLLALFVLTRRRIGPWLRFGPTLALAGIALATFDLARVQVPSPFRGDVAVPGPEAARKIFEPLHANIYRAFDYTKEGDIYDALTRSVSGDYLEQLYGQVYESLVLRDEGGAMSRVLSVELLDFRLLESDAAEGRPRFAARAGWRVKGAVFHWGHDHVRVHEYHARYDIVATPEGWRIAEHEVLEQERQPWLESIESEIPAIEREDFGR